MKKLITAAMVTAMLVSMTSCGNTSEAANTEYIYGEIDSVSGNDVVLLLADYNENADTEKSEEDDTEKEEKDSSEDSEKKSSKGFKKPENGEMPEGFDPESFSGGKPPEGFGKSEDGSGGFKKPEGFSKSKNSKYTLTGEQEEIRIPVGTTVTTSQGVKTDFDVLSEGDIIKCSVEKDSEGKDVVTEVWIMEQ